MTWLRSGSRSLILLAILGCVAACSSANEGGGQGDLGEPTADAADLNDGATSDTAADGGQDTDAEASDNGGADSGTLDASPVVVTGLETAPGASYFVETDPGYAASLSISAFLTYSDGSQWLVTDEVLWTTSNPQVVGLDPEGRPFATGQAEGQATLIALYGGLHSSLVVTVKFKNESPFVIKEGMTTDEVVAYEQLDDVASENGPSWLYPQEGTVFPNGMFPPLLQWAPNGLTFFRLALTNEDGLKVTIYTKEASFQPDRDLWLAIGSVSKGAVTMELSGAQTLEGTETVKMTPVRSVVSAAADLAGSVYYWEVKTGSILRLDGTQQYPSATPVFNDNAQTGQCRGCHTLSRDGSKLAYSFNAKGQGELGMAWATEPEPELLAVGSGVIVETMTYGPTGNLMVLSNLDRMWLADVTPGLNGGAFNMGDIHTVAASGNTERAQTPAWSPDGSALAYTKSYAGMNLLPGGTGSDLMVRYWDPENWKFIEPAVLLPAETIAGRPFHDYPTWSPDSKWIVARSTEKWATSSANSGLVGLTLAAVADGGFVELQTGAPVGTEHYGQPSFSPFMEGGYYWLVFYSDRPYGAVKPGNAKQLWVMAIDLDASTEADPSHPAFWLPGQDPTTVNLSGYWAQPYCHINGDQCAEDVDCCIGLNCTIAEGETVGVCEDAGCDLPGQYCDWKTSDCCSGYVCKQSLTGAFSCQPDWSE